jgi:hypothetical protein
MSYMSRTPLSGTITIRLSARSLRLLQDRARAQNKTASEVARELFESELETARHVPSAWELTRSHVGAVNSGPVVGGARAREALKSWKPDRRG